MSIRPIIKLPDPRLRQVSQPVETIDAEVQRLVDDMLETMYAAPGVGLAAIQIGVPKRIVVLDASREKKPDKPMTLINPEILVLGPQKRSYEEGCLSIPDVHVDIERPTLAEVRFLDRQGQVQTLQADDLLATVILHEIDHLNGKLIIDFLSRLKRDIIVRRFKKQAKDLD